MKTKSKMHACTCTCTSVQMHGVSSLRVYVVAPGFFEIMVFKDRTFTLVYIYCISTSCLTTIGLNIFCLPKL